jgi:hypothetical protein
MYTLFLPSAISGSKCKTSTLVWRLRTAFANIALATTLIDVRAGFMIPETWPSFANLCGRDPREKFAFHLGPQGKWFNCLAAFANIISKTQAMTFKLLGGAGGFQPEPQTWI